MPYVEPSPRRVRVRLGDTVVADSDRAQLLVQYGRAGLPTHYLPREDVWPGVLVDETGTGWSVVAGRRRCRLGLIAFSNERVDIVVDGAPQERPQSPWS